MLAWYKCLLDGYKHLLADGNYVFADYKCLLAVYK